MWILTQNGKRILSTEGMDEINVADPAEGRTDFAVLLHRRMDGKPFALGFYRKKDNAITVLIDILKAQAHVAIPHNFEMPLDTEMAFKSEIRVGKEKTA